MTEDIETPITERFASSALFKADAQFKYFTPVESSTRDRFGNRITTSNLAYYDKENKSKAAMLISPNGEIFIKENSKILNQIDKGLIDLTTKFKSDSLTSNIESTELGDSIRMNRINGGGQSEVYVLKTADRKCVIKTRTSASQFGDFSQPYIKEMLQVQSVSSDLHQELEDAKMELPDFLFASGQVSCTRFVEGSNPTEAELKKRLDIFLPSLVKYIELQHKSGNELWNNISPDYSIASGLKTDNFLVKPDGNMVWIDPFFFDDQHNNSFSTLDTQLPE